jgi:hypothetical protein
MQKGLIALALENGSVAGFRQLFVEKLFDKKLHRGLGAV